jgi:hypothetical protein
VGSPPTLGSRQVVALLVRHGFVEVCQRGSHKSSVLLRKIAADVRMTLDEFLLSR